MVISWPAGGVLLPAADHTPLQSIVEELCVSEAPPRHRAARHRAPSKFELTRDQVCDTVAGIGDRVSGLPMLSLSAPTRRGIAVTAVGGVLLTGGLAGAQTVIGSNADQAAATAHQPIAIGLADESLSDELDRSADRAPLAEKVTDPQALQDITAATKKAAADEAAAARRAAAEAAAAKQAEQERQEAARLASQDPRTTARAMLADYGWSADQFGCLDSLWVGESGWDHTATNPSSGAYGIPQSLPASKMATAGADWQTNPATQIKWGLGYIREVYGSPCSAEAFKQGNGWY